MLLSQPSLDGLAAEFPDRICGDPSGGICINSQDLLSGPYGRLVQAQVPLSDVPQRPVHGFLHEIALVRRSPLHHWKQLDEFGVLCVLVMPRKAS